MVEEILQGAGVLIWLSGELYAAKKGEDTTTSYVRRFMRKGPIGWLVRAGMAALQVWLFLHFQTNLGV